MIYENIINEVSESGGILCHRIKLQFRDFIFDSTRIAESNVWQDYINKQFNEQLKAKIESGAILGEISHPYELPKIDFEKLKSNKFKVEFDLAPELDKLKVRLQNFEK